MLRRLLLLTVAGVAAAATVATGQTTRVDGFKATLANVTDTLTRTVSVDLVRWSTDAERDRATAAVAKGDDAVRDALKGLPSVGYLWAGDPVGYSVRFAAKQAMPDGSERIVLATDQQLGAYSAKPWGAARPAETQAHPYTVIEIHLPKAGMGEGKISIAAKVSADTAAKMLTLDNYAGAPVMLRAVQRTSGTS